MQNSILKKYYEAVSNKNLDKALNCIDSNIHFISPMSEVKGKEDFSKAVEGYISMINTLSIRTICGNNEEAIILYNVTIKGKSEPLRTAAFARFSEGLIVHLELFFNAS